MKTHHGASLLAERTLLLFLDNACMRLGLLVVVDADEQEVFSALT